EFGAGAVVIALARARQDVRSKIDVATAIHVAETRQVARVLELIEALRAPIRAPQVLLAREADEAPHVEAERRAGAGVEAKRSERDAEQGRPATSIAGYGDVPYAVPVDVLVIQIRKLGVPHRPQRVGSELERTPPIVEAVDQDRHVVIRREVRIA